MSDYETLLRRARVVTPAATEVLDVALAGGRFVAIGPDLAGSAEVEIDAGGRTLFPGLVDAHVHFNEPGRAEWEGFATGSSALAAGGGTCFIDMPLNSSPPLLDRASFEAKRHAGEANSRLDFALWGGLTPDSLGQLAELGRCGVAGFKAFLCPSGLDEFGAADEAVLREGMKIAADLGLPVAVHAESPTVIAAYQAAHPPPRPGTMADWLASRPIEAELAAIAMALGCARDTGCALHVVHVSSAKGIALITAAKRGGIDVTAETCPHYLLLDAAAAIAIGPAAKCAPPLRSREEVDALWRCLLDGQIDTLGSDHSPSPPELKTGDDVFAIWGGIAGCQHGFPLLIGRTLRESGGHWERLAERVSGRPAARFGLAGRKGAIAEGLDADFCLLGPADEVIAAGDLLSRHPISPYLGHRLEWRVESTWLRGQPVSPATRGRFLAPIR